MADILIDESAQIISNPDPKYNQPMYIGVDYTYAPDMFTWQRLSTGDTLIDHSVTYKDYPIPSNATHVKVKMFAHLYAPYDGVDEQYVPSVSYVLSLINEKGQSSSSNGNIRTWISNGTAVTLGGNSGYTVEFKTSIPTEYNKYFSFTMESHPTQTLDPRLRVQFGLVTLEFIS